MKKIPAVLFDLDGTLVDVSSVRHFVEGSVRDFDAFHRASIDCPPNHHVLQALETCLRDGLAVLLVSGRSSTYSKLTDFWLAQNGIPANEVLLRSRYDRRPDIQVKTEMFHKLSQKYSILAAFEDSEQLMENWRDLRVRQVFDARIFRFDKSFNVGDVEDGHVE